jgi:peptide/nickel transport system permease protein
MLSAGKNFIQRYPFLLIAPGAAIAIAALSINMVGDGLRDSLDPKLKD